MDCQMDQVFARRLLHQQSKIKEVYVGKKGFQLENSENELGAQVQFQLPKPIFHSTPARGGFSKTLLENNARTKRSRTADRYIPKRLCSNWQSRFSLENDSDEEKDENSNKEKTTVNMSTLESGRVYSSLLKNEILDSSIGSLNNTSGESKLFHYSPNNRSKENCLSHTLSPIGASSQRLLSSPKFENAKIATVPFKVLDAPNLQDDFYLNLIDWSSQNILSVGLGNSVYFWSAVSSQITGLCELSEHGNSVTSVSWNPFGTHLAIGTNHGSVLIWDVVSGKQIDRLTGHCGRVGTLSWNTGNFLTSGGRDRSIIQRDLRARPSSRNERRLCGHRQEVCGLKWSTDGQLLASGGNDNKLLVWGLHSNEPLFTFYEHTSAVKAISWSPHNHGLLATGGGSADRTIRFWNMITGQSLHFVDTGSQVCNLAWSKHSSQLVSTHGYSQNQILLWNYPSMTQVVKLTGHSLRVLYLALSPDGETIVTGAGDETLRFWNIFSKTPSRQRPPSQVMLYTNIR
ncbi:fizzy-related protein homolog [Cimex lectularius]|uniref:Fizzy-related protein homolog n=1 Tax=Cimex lectularius TaxID=79782 RepID=A0A8I6REZ0_CIMLE|nr:fizzy-related protein homolog [Cimex lectularius]